MNGDEVPEWYLLIPEFSSLIAKQYKKRILEVCKKVFFVTSIFSILLSIIFYLFADKISLLVFNNLECAKYIKILSPIVLFIYTDNILDNMLKGLNKQFGVMFCNIVDLILTICILYFTLPVLGPTGYLLAIMISEIFNFIISFIFYFVNVPVIIISHSGISNVPLLMTVAMSAAE